MLKSALIFVFVACMPCFLISTLNKADEDAKTEVWKTLEELNTAWATNGDTEALREYFHERMVAISPGVRERIVGRGACIAEWKKFVDAAEIHSWRDYDPRIELFGDGRFAVVTCYWEMKYTIAGTTYDSGGRDMVVLVKENGRWWVVADKFSSFPEE